MRDRYGSDPNGMNYWPRQLPPPERVEVVRDLLKQGRTFHHIQRVTGMTTNRIGYIKAEPRVWDTYIDTVAVDRAYRGDASVLPALTLFERAALMRRLDDRYDAEPFEPTLNGVRPKRWGNGEIEMQDAMEQWWLHDLAKAWGVNADRLRDQLVTRCKRRRKAA